MGVQGNAPKLTTAEKAIINQAFQNHNAKFKGGADAMKQLDAGESVFIKKENGVVTVKVDAYGYDGKNLTNGSDGVFDLEFTFEDDTYDSNKKYEFTEADNSAGNIKKLVDQARDADKKINQKEVPFDGDKDGRLTNIQDINTRFASLMGDKNVKVTPGVATENKPAHFASMADLDASIENLEALYEKLEDVNITSSSEFLLDKDRKALMASTNNKKEVKALRKEMLADVEKAIDDLKAMKKTLLAEQKQAVKDKNAANEALDELGVDKEARIKMLAEGKGITEAAPTMKHDMKHEEFDYKMPEAEILTKDKVKFVDITNLPGQFANADGIAQKMTRLAAETAIKKFNEEQKDKSAQINMDNIAAITINPSTGDILIGMKDSQPKAGEAAGHDGHFDYKIPGFYNNKSGVMNPDGLKVENYGSQSTKGLQALRNSLMSAIDEYKAANSDEIGDAEANIKKQVKKLAAALVDEAEVKKMLTDAGVNIDISKIYD